MKNEMIQMHENGVTPEFLERLKSDPQFRLDSLIEGLKMTERGILMAAYALTEMEKAGDEIPECIVRNRSFVNLMHRIADGQALPQIAINYRFRPSLAETISSYALQDQERIAKEESIPVVVKGATGRTTRQLKPHEIIGPLEKQVFGKDGIRNETQQSAYLDGLEIEKPAPRPADDIVFIKKSDVVRIKKDLTLTRADWRRIGQAMGW